MKVKRHYKLVFAVTTGLIFVCSVLGAIQETGNDDPQQPKHPKIQIHVRPKNQPVQTPPIQEQPGSSQKLQSPPEGMTPQSTPVPKSTRQEPVRQLPPQLPPSVVPQNVPGEQPQANHEGSSSDLAVQVLTHKFGAERVQQILKRVQGAGGEGAPSASPYFDGAHVLTGSGEIVPREQTQFFRGSAAAPREPVPAGNFSYKPTTVQDAQQIPQQYGSVPGGVVLEGQADLGPLANLTYDSRFNALVVDDRAVYFLKVSPRILVELCRALAQKDQIGVSLGAVQISYGALPKKSELAGDLLLTDHFLGSIAFAWNDWTAGYNFAGGYEPQQFQGSMHAAVFFRFSGFQFQVEQQEFKVVQENFNDQFIPLSNQVAADGGSLPDEAAIMAANTPSEWEMNLRHVAENMAYYRREKLIEQTFSYGATAAFLRGLKAQGVDLSELANAIEAEVGDTSETR